MAQSNQIDSISHRHSMIMNWMVLNPHRSLRECADHFGITQAWLSTVIHSDVFQAEFQDKLQKIHVRCAESIPEKLRVVADIALEKLAEKISDSEDPEFILDAADKALHRMGYAPASARNGYGASQGSVSIQQNMFMLSQEDLDKARGIMRSQGMFPEHGQGPGIPQAPAHDLQAPVEADE
jgi:predicted RecB family endonuclease